MSRAFELEFSVHADCKKGLGLCLLVLEKQLGAPPKLYNAVPGPSCALCSWI